MSEIKRIQELVYSKLKEANVNISKQACFRAVKEGIFEAQDWISVEERQAPIGVHLMISVDGIHSAGFLCNKRSNGKWFDCFNREITDQNQIKYWRFPIIDTDEN